MPLPDRERLPLPPQLHEYLRGEDYAALWQATSIGTVMIAKTPSGELTTLHGPLPMGISHQLYRHESAPVIRSQLTIHDRPDSALALETFTNIADPEQHQDFAQLAQQDQIHVLFYNDEALHVLTKRLRNARPKDITRIVLTAAQLHDRIPHDLYDFDRAKADIIARTHL